MAARIGYSVAELAIEAGVGRDGIYAAIRDGRLEAKKYGKRTIITHAALEKFLNELPALKLPAADAAPETAAATEQAAPQHQRKKKPPVRDPKMEAMAKASIAQAIAMGLIKPGHFK